MRYQLDYRHLDEPAKYDQLVERFADAAWWERTGPLGGLHLLNDVRAPYFDKALIGGFAGKRILDVGCGGGIFAEYAARAGARVVAIDPSSRSIEVAQGHAQSQGLEIDYRCAYAETFTDPEPFDAVFAVDVLEHVAHLDATLDMCAQVMKPKGLFGFLTHNQTLEAFTFLIWHGEYELGFVPKGNHDFHKFIRPDELRNRLAARGLRVAEICGLDYLMDDDQSQVIFARTPAISYLGYAIKR
jgi:2-polyprenyl-6-hydroxyphenyl methylase / 3-demethylubiquinone-9 3-methyltransferase